MTQKREADPSSCARAGRVHAARLPQVAYPTSGTRDWGHEEEEEDEDEAEDEAEVKDNGYGEYWRTHVDVADMASWAGQPSVKGSTESMRMALLTFSLIGISFTWGIEMTYCTPYLLALGLTKSRTSLVWIAGPLSGIIMQPIVGVIADRSRSKYGRRRPFMVVGSLIVCLMLMVLAWTKEIVGFFVPDEPSVRGYTIALAVMSIYAIDFAINAVQSCTRSLIVDTLPIQKQQLGSAWGGRMGSVGSVIGYVLGTLDLVAIFGTSFGDTQFKKLTLIAAFSLIFAIGVTCWAVTERILISGKESEAGNGGIVQIFSQIFRTTMSLPPRIQAICWVQFWSWIGWFPFLFYSSTWVGETYFRYDAPHDMKGSKDALGDVGRIGSMALVVFSTFTATGAWILPLLVRSPDEDGFTPRPLSSMAGFLTKLSKHKPDLLTAWIFAHLTFSFAMMLAPLAGSFRFATALMAICGFPWVIAGWAPSTFMGIEVNRLSSGAPMSRTNGRLSTDDSIDMSPPSSPTLLRLEHGPDNDAVASTGELSGLYFGILNIYNTLPQFLSTFISTIIFSILEPGKSPELAHDADPEEHHSTDGPNAIAICLFVGALSSLVAAYSTRKLKHL